MVNLIVHELMKDDFFKIFFASIISALTAILSVTPEYQFFKTVDRELWINLLRMGGNVFINCMISVIVAIIIIEVIHFIIKFIDEILTNNIKPK